MLGCLRILFAFLVHDLCPNILDSGLDRRQHNNNHNGDDKENDHDQVDGQQDLAQARELKKTIKELDHLFILILFISHYLPPRPVSCLSSSTPLTVTYHSLGTS